LSKNFLNSFFDPSSGALVHPIIVILVLSSINLVLHFAIAFFILAGLEGSDFFFFAPLPFLPFFLAGQTFSHSSI
jgi:hypothetical protein